MICAWKLPEEALKCSQGYPGPMTCGFRFGMGPGHDAFSFWCWRRLLRVPWTARKSNQSVLKEINPKYSLEGLMLKLKLQYFGHLMQRTDLKRSWCWERLKAGEGDDRGWDGWMASSTRWTWIWVNSGSWWWTGRPGMLQSMGRKELDMTEWLNWTELRWLYSFLLL